MRNESVQRQFIIYIDKSNQKINNMKKNKKQQPKQIFLQRIKCGCVAQKHDLINNCLSCGKVVCAQEGQGPCLYCGQIVTRPDGKYITNDDSLFPTLPKDQLNKISQQRSKAILHKNTLVERDKSTSMGQNIYDEHTDYYDVSENQWLDEQDRKKAVDRLLQREKYIEQEQFKQKIVFDPVSNQFITQEFQFNEEDFKKEGKEFMEEREKKAYEQKMEKAKSNWDNRIMKNEKMHQLIEEIASKNPQKKEKHQNRNKVIEIVVEEEATEMQKKQQ